ncbi:MAG: hypothetical protein J6W27_04075 [Alphaproteobacteria bacterium]|nr:hypothetical protein [Alphaproteobacteria bacterium]
MRKYLFVFLSSFVICGTAMADGCPAGQYKDPSTDDCVLCPKGTFNATSNSMTPRCTACSSGYTTIYEGSREETDCIHYVDKFCVDNDCFEWPATISPEARVDTTYLSFQ